MRPAHLLAACSICPLAAAQFGPATPITNSASAPYAIEVVDLNGDGVNDILIAAFSNDQVAWYPGTGAGTYGAQQVLANDLTNASSCAAADLDGDGDLDVAAVGFGADRVVWFRNDGGGNFGPQRVLSNTANGPWGVHAVDVDADGLVDVFVACGEGDLITWYRNLGSGQFAAEAIISAAVNDPRMISSGDVDNDGDIDLVSASAGDNKVAWYPNLGGGLFGAQVVINNTLTWAVDAFTVDMDGDGDLDVLSANQTGDRIAWHPNDGLGVFGTAQTVAITASTLSATYPADLDGDGDLDVLSCSSSDDRIAWYANNGSGVFGAQQVISSTVDNPLLVVAGDVDNDGDMDVVSSGSTADRLDYFANSGTGLFGSSFLLATSETSNPLMSLTVDINGDGACDVVTVSNGDSKLAWYANTGDGTMGPQQVVATAAGMRYAHAADVDGDGDIDLFSINPPGSGFGLSLNGGSGQFAPRIDLGTVPLLYGITSGDVDGDNDVDILFGLVDENGLKVGTNNGDGTFVIPAFDFNTTSVRDVFMLADIEGDDDLDIVIANPWDDQYEWYANDGLGIFGPAQTLGSVLAATINEIFWEDMNGDGNKDLVAATEDDDRIVWFPNLGGGAFGPEEFIATVNGPRGVDVADLDGDGDLDIAATSWFTGGGVFYCLNDGSGVFGPTVLIDPSPYGPIHLNAADMDGDGDPDLVVTSNLDDRVSWYENYFGSAYRMEGRLFHDLDANGLADDGEPGVSWFGMATTPYASTALTGTDGNYIIYADSGAYQVAPLLTSVFWQVTSVPAVHDALLTAADPVALGLDLGITAAVDTSLITASVHTMPGVCESDVLQYLVMANQGTRIEQGRVTLDLDTLFTFNSAEPPPDMISDNHYEWNFTDLGYDEVRTIVVNVTRPPSFFLNDTLNALMQVLRTDLGDAVTDTFSYAWFEPVLCSYDPNDKQVRPQGTGPMGIVDIETPHLDYTIRFQNTGNAPAVDVTLRDEITDLLVNTNIQVLGYSHGPSRIFIGSGGELVVEFDGINLPDSGSSYVLSQGFFSFRVAVRSDLPSGTVIANNAAIFFDLNAPVITNSVVNTLIDCALFEASINDQGSGLVQASEGITYQWLLGGVPILGASGASYQAVNTGFYTVVTTSAFNCIAVSDPLFVGISAVPEPVGAIMRIHPNPVHGNAFILADRPLSAQHRIEVRDALGRLHLDSPGMGTERMTLNTDALAPGLYVVRLLEAGNTIGAARILVQ